MPVVGVASKLRQPSAVGTKPVHTALPIPSAVRAATSQGFMAQPRELRASEGDPGLVCQLSIKSEFQQERRPNGKSGARTEESRICKVSGGGGRDPGPLGRYRRQVSAQARALRRDDAASSTFRGKSLSQPLLPACDLMSRPSLMGGYTCGGYSAGSETDRPCSSQLRTSRAASSPPERNLSDG